MSTGEDSKRPFEGLRQELFSKAVGDEGMLSVWGKRLVWPRLALYERLDPIVIKLLKALHHELGWVSEELMIFKHPPKTLVEKPVLFPVGIDYTHSVSTEDLAGEAYWVLQFLTGVELLIRLNSTFDGKLVNFEVACFPPARTSLQDQGKPKKTLAMKPSPIVEFVEADSALKRLIREVILSSPEFPLLLHL